MYIYSYNYFIILRSNNKIGTLNPKFWPLVPNLKLLDASCNKLEILDSESLPKTSGLETL